tara:strand:- start:55 stop:186 length:132 start_codon:yes stop_codon:yes gene_type:complete
MKEIEDFLDLSVILVMAVVIVLWAVLDINKLIVVAWEMWVLGQ